DADGISARRAVYALSGESLVSFFDELVAEWHGWEGTKEWGSLEGDFTLAATHDGLGTVTLRAHLWHNGGLEWSATVELALHAGEQLKMAASAVTRFVRAT